MAAQQQQQQQQQQQSQLQAYAPWPLYDLFLDVPHPAASPHCPPAVVVGPPPNNANNNNTPNESIAEELQKSMPQIALFAFPEFDAQATPPPPPQPPNNTNQQQPPPVNRYDQYAMQPPAFQNYTFSLTLQSGQRVQGHVRRYLPSHGRALSRYDVGRRGERAFVILTRVTGADVIYAAILKMVDAISSHKAAMRHLASVPTNTQNQPTAPPLQQAFLHEMFGRHQALARLHASTPPEKRKAAEMLSIPNLEVGTSSGTEQPQSINNNKFAMVDSTHFLMPTTPLLMRTSMVGADVANLINTSILPVLRCLGVAHTLRLLCGLLSERRVILISASPTRLATCCKSAMAMLAQGLLHWHHLYIPVLPPHLWQYLAAPYPYLIGILASLTPRLDHTDGLADVLIINLDHNTMETRGIPRGEVDKRIPDLLLNVNSDQYSVSQQLGGAAVGNTPQQSAPMLLAQDLVELLKQDKKILNGESALASMQDTAVKATKAVKATFFKLKEKGKMFMNKKTSSYSENDPSSTRTEEEAEQPAEPPAEVNSMAPDFIYTEGCRNEICEEEARLAFCSFYLSMIGDMRWYMNQKPGQVAELDRDRLRQFKLANNEGEQMGHLLLNFCQTQMLEEFAKHRIQEVTLGQRVTNVSPRFLQCAEYHKSHNIDFNVLSIRRVSRQIAQGNASAMLQLTNARRMAMELTSKRAFEGDYNKALADLVEQCRESSSVLYDVMSVVWIRMRDNRGLQWRHATHSLHILKNLLFHGPLAAVAEATDGLDKIRALKYYNGNRQTSICVQIRTAATQVYNLIVDRSKLYQIRRVCISKRRSLRKQDNATLSRDTRLMKVASVTFQKVHAAMHPNAPRAAPAAVAAPRTPPPSAQPAYNATPTYAVLPPAPAQQQQAARPPAQQQQQQQQQKRQSGDLLGLQQPAAASVSSSGADLLGVFGAGQQQAVPAPASSGSDILGLFGDMSVGSAGQAQQAAGQYAPQQQQRPPPQQHVAPQYAVAQQPQQGQYHQHQQHQQPPQQYRSHSTSPTPPQQQARAQQQPPPAGQYAPHQQQPSVNQHGQRTLSPQRPGGPQYAAPPQQPSAGYGHPGQPAQGQPGYPVAPSGYQPQPGAPPAFAQPGGPAPNGYAPQAPPQAQQGFQPVPTPPSSYGYQQQQAQPGRAGQSNQTQQQQQGPFF